MNCQQCRDVVVDVARGIAHADEATALDHVRGCEACGRYLQQQRALTAGLRALGTEAIDVPSAELEQRVLAAIDVAGRDCAVPQSPSASRLVRGGWLKVAAAIVIAASLVVLWQWRPQAPTGSTAHGRGSPTGPTIATARSPAPSATVATRASAPEPTVAVNNARSVAGRGRDLSTRPAATRRPRIVQAVGFVALPSAATLPPFEHGEIVRVRIQMAALAGLGFTVQPDAADTTPINADLLVGQDGQPRAIRLVTTNTQDSRSRR